MQHAHLCAGDDARCEDVVRLLLPKGRQLLGVEGKADGRITVACADNIRSAFAAAGCVTGITAGAAIARTAIDAAAQFVIAVSQCCFDALLFVDAGHSAHQPVAAVASECCI